MRKLGLLFLLGLLSGWAHGTTWYVTTTGSNSNPCTLASPCATPDFAYNNKAAPGDTVNVAVGTYTYGGNVKFTTSGSPGNYITLQCVSRGACKIQTTNATSSGTEPVLWIQAGYIVIDGFEITNNNNTVPNVDIGLYMDNNTLSHRTITHNIVHHIESACSVNGGAGISASNHSGDGDIWDSNLVYDIGWNNPACNSVRQVSALNFEANSPARGIITNNIVYMSKGGWCMQDTATAIGTTGTTIANNLFFNCGDGGLIIATNGSGGTIDYNIVSNNTILNNGGQGGSTISSWGIFEFNDGSYGTHNVYKNNNLFGNAPANYEFEGGGSQTGGISIDPSAGTTFINWQMNGTGDYREKAGSPTIAAGIVTGAPNHDFNSNPRPFGAGYDIGAYQFNQRWYVRPDGGTRYSANVPTGQCNGLFDTAYPGIGTNQNCAYKDFRYIWDDDSGVVGLGTWQPNGGDTVVIRGCTANANQVYPSNPNCRIGWDSGFGTAGVNDWCRGIGNQDCKNPTITAGTSIAHTKILSGWAFDHPGSPVSDANKQQLFCGFGLTRGCFNLQGTQYLDIVGIELTTHNKVSAGNPGAGGNCTLGGSPAFPVSCQNGTQPYDDYAQNGFVTDNTSANITLTDVNVHGFNASGFWGPIGPGAITMTRVNSNFNGFAGWNFADQSDTPNASGAAIIASSVTMIGNGCYEQYPIVNAFPARACYDGNSGGFGDAWSGQDTTLDTFTCDHCTMMYNTKDAFIGPHAQVGALTVTNTTSIGNMGAQMKYGSKISANVLFENNLFVMNCFRMSATLPGAAQNFAQSTGLGGSYLTNFCRAGGDGWAFLTRATSTNHFYGNTIIAANATIMDVNCGFVDSGGVHEETNCNTSPLIWTGNNILGYTDPIVGQQPGLWFFDPGAGGSIVVTSSHNNDFGVRNISPEVCGTNNITCVDPLMVSEPAQPWPGSEAALDVYNPFGGSGNSFYPTAPSPLRGMVPAFSGSPATDFYAIARPNPFAMGGVELGGVLPVTATPTCTPGAGTYPVTQTVTCSSTTPASTTYCTVDGSTPTTGSPVCTSISVSVSSPPPLKAISAASGFSNSSINNSVYTITPIVPVVTLGGQVVVTGKANF